MKKPGKKSIIPAMVIAGGLAYNTLGDVVKSAYNKITPDNAQHEVAPDKANALEEILTPNKAYAGENTTQKDYPSDEILKERMNQPVEKTLEETDYTKVNDSNYQQEVLEADRPTMVLFYGTDTGSQGLATLTRTLHEKFPEIKVCAYNDGTGDTMTRTEFDKLAEKYPLETAPALLFYEEKDNGSGTKNMGKNWHLQGGIKTLGFLQDKIDAYNQYIPKRLVD